MKELFQAGSFFMKWKGAVL